MSLVLVITLITNETHIMRRNFYSSRAAFLT